MAVLVLLLHISMAIAPPQSELPPSQQSHMSGVVEDVQSKDGQAGYVDVVSGSARIPHRIVIGPSTAISKGGQSVRLADIQTKQTLSCTGDVRGDQLVAGSCTVQ